MERKRIEDLYRHMEWADSQVWGEILRRGETASDARLAELLHHLHSVHLAYLQIWRGEPPEVPELDAFADAGALRTWSRQHYRAFPTLIGKLDREALGRRVELPWADRLVEHFGKAEPVTMEETLLQVVFHSTYHRGQINLRLRELGGEPPLTDYIAWIWMGRPGPQWSEEG